MRTALYLRVSTAHQTADNQLHELERVAAARGWNIVRTFRDDGISGSKGRARPHRAMRGLEAPRRTARGPLENRP